MTSGEAIERLIKHCCKSNSCTDSCMYGTECCEYSLATEALERQIPKKPKKQKYYSDLDFRIGYCSHCGYDINQEMKFCSDCGQRLDWSD